MRKATWIRRGILCSLMTVCFATAFGPTVAEAGWTGSQRGGKTPKESEIAAENKKETSQSSITKELEKKNKELEKLRNTKIPYMVSCTYCGGSGESDAACKKCNGTGIADTPGNFSFVVPCGYCMGSGREACSMCMGGKMKNPNYSAQCGERDKKIKTLENEIAQLNQKLVPKETKQIQSITEEDYPIHDNDEWEIPKTSIDCVICKGTGKVICSSCKGSGYLEKTNTAPDYSGNGGTQYTTSTKCSCDNGFRSCIYCGGTGKR